MDATLEQVLTRGQFYEMLEAHQSTKYLAVACFALLVYDYLLTLEQEIKLFWRPKITITRVLFFLNRYVPPINFIVVLAWFFRPSPSYEVIVGSSVALLAEDLAELNLYSCYGSMVSTATFTVFELIIMQAILVARVVHLWTWNQKMQRFVFGFFVACVVTVALIFGFVMRDTDAEVLPLPLAGCFDVSTGPNSHLYWAMLVPTFIMETVLMVLTVVRIARPLQKSEYNNKLLKCLVRDGCIFYLCVCACVGFGVVGSAMWDHYTVSFPAVFSGFLPVILSICASHLLFNLHELAEELVGEPTFALNNVELGRLNLRSGPRHGEFIVDVQGGGVGRFNGDGRSRWSRESSVVSSSSFDSEFGGRDGDGKAKMLSVTSERDWLPFIRRLSEFRFA